MESGRRGPCASQAGPVHQALPPSRRQAELALICGARGRERVREHCTATRCRSGLRAVRRERPRWCGRRILRKLLGPRHEMSPGRSRSRPLDWGPSTAVPRPANTRAGRSQVLLSGDPTRRAALERSREGCRVRSGTRRRLARRTFASAAGHPQCTRVSSRRSRDRARQRRRSPRSTRATCAVPLPRSSGKPEAHPGLRGIVTRARAARPRDLHRPQASFGVGGNGRSPFHRPRSEVEVVARGDAAGPSSTRVGRSASAPWSRVAAGASSTISCSRPRRAEASIE